MATLKIKFRPSTIDGKEGYIYYQVLHNRVARQQKTSYRLHAHEWDNESSKIIFSQSNEQRKIYLSEIHEKIQTDVQIFHEIILHYRRNTCIYTTDNIIEDYIANNSNNSLFVFMENVISTMKELGRIRISETYATTLKSFKRFREGRDIQLTRIDSDVIVAYENFLKRTGVTINTSSFYLRNLRAVYNRAVEKGLTVQRFPFKHVFTGVDKTSKRAIPISTLKEIMAMDLSGSRSMDFARDMFLFSFYTRGMSFVDMAYLKKKDLNRGVLSYRRRKTGQLLYIRWEQCMLDIVKKYDIPESEYLLPIIKPNNTIDKRKQYIYSCHNINRSLKQIGFKLGLYQPLTMYVSRHSWASIAKSKNVPISVICEGMGHNSEATTRIYLASLDSVAIDKANSMILKSLK